MSPKACLGILRRAMRRGKELPKMLEEALTECVRLWGKEFGPEEIANAGEILRTLWEKVDTQTFGEWVRRTAILVQQEKVLLCGMCQQDDGRNEIGTACEFPEVQSATCEKYGSICPVRYLWENWLHGGSSQGQESDEQFSRKLGALVQKLSFQAAPFQTFMCCLRSASEGTPALREALASVEEEYQAWLGHRIHSQHQESDGDGELTDDGVRCLNPWDSQSIRQYDVSGIAPSINANSHGGQNRWGVCYPAAFMGGQGAKAGSIAYCDDGTTPTLKASPSGGNTVPDICYAIKGNFIDMDTRQNGVGWRDGEMYTLDATDRHAVALDCRNMVGNEELSATLQAKNEGGFSLNYVNPICYRNGGYGDMVEGIGTLRANGGDAGGGTESIIVERVRREGER